MFFAPECSLVSVGRISGQPSCLELWIVSIIESHALDDRQQVSDDH